MQPLQCVSQHHLHIHAAITMRFASTRCGTPRENRLRPKRSQPHPPHTQGTLFIAGCSRFKRKNKVSCSGFLHKTSPMQHACSHYNAFCSITCSNPHVSTHMATKRDSNHATITLRFASIDSKTPCTVTTSLGHHPWS